jgi:cell division protein FtsI/penicillin-binding protein 2
MAPSDKNVALLPLKRIRVWHTFIILIIAFFGLRLFYLQIIRYDHYKTAALSDQLKQYEIPATRGIISAYDGGASVPIVLNQTLYTIYADPAFIKHPETVAATLANVFGGTPNDYSEKLTRQGSRYVIIAKKVSKATKSKLLGYDYAGIGAQAQSYRVYPQGSLASQLLGFVNNDGKGVYGIEQALNSTLSGTPGRLKAITDVHGVPLAASDGNISVPAVPGKKVQLTIDLGMQKQMENILKDQYKKTHSEGLSAVIIDPNTGQVKAMANYPTFNPSDSSHTDVKLFRNNAASLAIEPGSSMKPLIAAAALDSGSVTPNTTYFDHAKVTVNGYTITNIEGDGGPGEQSVQSILSLSLNTGATWLLMRLGGSGDAINMGAITRWHNYMVGHYRFGQRTHIEQGYESPGYVPAADKKRSAIQLTYANTAFGQGVQVTALQMALAYSSVLNGGTYYQPTLINSYVDANGQVTTNRPKVLGTHVVNESVSRSLTKLLQGVVNRYYGIGFRYMKFPDGYIVGGKTGTAQVASPGGGYHEKYNNGSYIGFVGGQHPQYVIAVYNIKPHLPADAYAGSAGGQPVFGDLAHMLIDNGYVVPKQ